MTTSLGSVPRDSRRANHTSSTSSVVCGHTPEANVDRFRDNQRILCDPKEVNDAGNAIGHNKGCVAEDVRRPRAAKWYVHASKVPADTPPSAAEMIAEGRIGPLVGPRAHDQHSFVRVAVSWLRRVPSARDGNRCAVAHGLDKQGRHANAQSVCDLRRHSGSDVVTGKREANDPALARVQYVQHGIDVQPCRVQKLAWSVAGLAVLGLWPTTVAETPYSCLSRVEHPDPVLVDDDVADAMETSALEARFDDRLHGGLRQIDLVLRIQSAREAREPAGRAAYGCRPTTGTFLQRHDTRRATNPQAAIMELAT